MSCSSDAPSAEHPSEECPTEGDVEALEGPPTDVSLDPAALRDAAFMREAIAEARAAEARGEVPVGCVIVRGDEIVARGHNLRETRNDPTAHAELLALREAAQQLESWRLEDATVYVTLEPCPMCAGALVNARVARVVYGADDPKAGATTTLYTIGSDARLNHRFALAPGVLAEECGALLSEFFGRIRAARRAAKKAQREAPVTLDAVNGEPADATRGE